MKNAVTLGNIDRQEKIVISINNEISKFPAKSVGQLFFENRFVSLFNIFCESIILAAIFPFKIIQNIC